MLTSDRDCEVDDGPCAGVDLEYSYRWRDSYRPLLAEIAAAVHRHSDGLSHRDRQALVASVVAVAWAETNWGTYERTTYAIPRETGEVSPFQIISCEYAPWRERGIRCSDHGYVDTNTRPTVAWLTGETCEECDPDWSNAADWVVQRWLREPDPRTYNGCERADCGYADRFTRRYRAAMRAM